MKFYIENTFPDVVANDLVEFCVVKAEAYNSETSVEFDESMAKTIAETERDNITMYTGNLNPKWKFWDDVCKELDKKKE